MSADEKLKIFLDDFEKTLVSFKTAMSVNLDNISEELKDLVKNGQIQKFEICAELSWKTSKWYLERKNGVVLNSPIPVFKTLYTEKHIPEDIYLALYEMIRIRNIFSHVYKEEYLLSIIPDFPKFIVPLEHLLTIMKQI